MLFWFLVSSPTAWLVLALVWIFSAWYLERRRYPPGPLALPGIGTLALLRLGDDYISKLSELGKTYGPVFTIYIGTRPWVVIGGYEAAREALVTKAPWFSSRPALYHSIQTVNPKQLGLVEAPYDEGCVIRRKFSLMVLRSFAFGRQSLEDKITTETSFMIEEFEKVISVPFDAHDILYSATSNIICSIMFGSRFEYSDREFHKLMYLGDVFFKEYEDLIDMDDYPLIHSLPQGKKAMKEHEETMHQFKTFIMKQIERHQATRDPENPRDYIDMYLNEIKNASHKDFTLENLWILIFDFITAGTQTVSKTLRWSLVYLANYPDVQDKMFAEIDDVIGKDVLPSISQKHHMPYNEAAIHEIMRICSVAPSAIPHMTTKDTSVAGHTVPDGTNILVNIFAVHYDTVAWPEPHILKPQRFLDDQGNFVKMDHWVPFSLGRRHCLGKEMALKELFIFITSLVQRFRFSPPDGATKLPEDGICGFTRGPVPYKICAKPRV